MRGKSRPQMALYSVRSERMVCEQLGYRWPQNSTHSSFTVRSPSRSTTSQSVRPGSRSGGRSVGV